MRVFLDLMWFFRRHPTRYIVGILLLMMVALLSLIPPRIVGLIINNLTHHTLTRGKLYDDLLIILITALVTYVIRYLWRILLFGGAIQLGAELRTRLYNHFTLMSPEFYHHKRIGDLMAHSTNDVQAIQDTASEGVLTLVDSITTGTVVITTMAFINWKLTIISLLPMPLMAYAVTRYGKMLHDRFYLAQAAFSDINDRVQEYVSGIRVVRAFGQEQWERENFVALSRDVVDKSVAVARIDSLFDPTISVIVGLSYFLSIAVGAWFVVHGSLNLGSLTTFTLYLGQLIWPMLAFGFLFNIVERGSASYERVKHLLAIAPAVTNRPHAVDVVPTGRVAFDIHHFCYPENDRPVLKDIVLEIEKGQTLGIVGRTGSGKTTLMRLLLREFDLKTGEGNILIGNVSIYDVTLDALRQSIAYAPQDAFIFSETVAQNIAFGKPDATHDEIVNAAYLASILEDVQQFPQGFETVVGERGTNLSGGQKQRISIARALLQNAEILLLDDTLSAVDARTETHILDSIKKNRQGRTTIIATHRLRTVEHADQIIVLENGTIVERGTHESLWALGGRYWDMYRRQQLETQVEQGGIEV
ncbi:ABC transporter transmembrane domain-containing protein [Sulfobacillus thermosulfidooxidans]|uniref:ABC transporter transmembrane domain-containing protein n=1 Tax=Sulfobacillus thermosulfidooxidans TaxID=28034 RepID=UPI00096BCFDC|nr:ABC transporter transmembrane domain-containing protein [Sulfobacillus thermosulfidooxidans]OLZ08426.1 multidrug ABC transporter permease/ATP-binding protein [Sulfobacillus thermosulfidooxidans]OLZ14499.1 multidrug ABC transporter permease/ATP-binding protein [Sulfobacillus thermosulfidooxidans]OLZ20582.1 multidrug ABC transporter permease/ATP-binding protein [Sulfobacillus thermosulfidooxidans]